MHLYFHIIISIMLIIVILLSLFLLLYDNYYVNYCYFDRQFLGSGTCKCFCYSQCSLWTFCRPIRGKITWLIYINSYFHGLFELPRQTCFRIPMFCGKPISFFRADGKKSAFFPRLKKIIIIKRKMDFFPNSWNGFLTQNFWIRKHLIMLYFLRCRNIKINIDFISTQNEIFMYGGTEKNGSVSADLWVYDVTQHSWRNLTKRAGTCHSSKMCDEFQVLEMFY